MLRTVPVISLMSMISFQALADDKARFRVGHNVLTHTSASVEEEPDVGDSVTYKDTSLEMFAGGWEFYIAKDAFNVYVYPGQKNSSILAGYSILPTLEAGLVLNLSSSKHSKATSAPKSDKSGQTFGVYATYYLALGASGVLEASFIPTFGSAKSKETDAAGVETESDTASSNYTLMALYDHRCVENLHYYISLSYTMGAQEEKESKLKTSSSTIAITPVGFRYDIL